MEEYLLPCSPGDKGQEKDLLPPNPTFVSPPRPSPTPSRKPPAAATGTAEVTLTVCFTFWDLIPAWSRSILFGVLWKFCVFPAVPQTFVGQGGLAHSFPKLLSAFFPPTGSAMTLHLCECKSFPLLTEFVSLPPPKKSCLRHSGPWAALETGHQAQPGIVSSILEFHINRITQCVLFVCGFFWSALHLGDSS